MSDPGQLAELKRESGKRVSVSLPALNEQTTIGDMCTSIRVDLMEKVELVDELVVVDSGSEDDTLEVAEAAEAEIHSSGDLSDALVQFIPKENGPLAVRFDQEIIERPAMANSLLQS